MGYNFKQYLLSCVAYIIPLANIAALIFFCMMPGKEARVKAARALSEKLKQAEEASEQLMGRMTGGLGGFPF